MSNGIERFWGDGRLPFAPVSDRLYDGLPKLGLVIGTYAAVPYVHLQLEARQRRGGRGWTNGKSRSLIANNGSGE